MALDFPASPSNGQIFSSGGISWTFDGEKWKISSSGIEPVFISSSTPTGVAGQIYWDSDESTAYIYYDDGNTAQWVPLVSTAPVSFDTSAIVSGTLPVARGGTGTTSFDAGKIAEGDTEAEVVDTGSDGHFKVTTEGTERVRVGPAGQIGLGGANYGTDGQCLTSTGTTTAPEWRTPPLTNINKIINGDMRIDQRNSGAALTVNSTDKHFAVDRFYGENSSNGVFTLQQSTEAPAGFKNSIVATVTTASGALSATHYAAINSQIEGQDIYDLDLGTSDAKYFTLSFWVRSSVTGTYGGSFRNNNDSRNYPFSYSINVADTWEKKHITVAGDTSGTWLTNNDVGLKVWFSLAAGSTYSGTAGAWTSTLHISPTGATNLLATNSATWYLTGVKLEAGQTATDFEHRSFNDELARCQRYYCHYGYPFETVTVGQRVGAGFVTAPTQAHMLLPTGAGKMRANPTPDHNDVQINDASTNKTISNFGTVTAYNGHVHMTMNTPSGLTEGRACNIRFSTTSGNFFLNAEL